MTPIKNLSPDELPREKLLKLGSNALSDAELIGILIGSGNREQNAVELSRDILAKNDHKLDTLAKATVKDLQQFKGIGEAKAITIVSALELSRRRKQEDTKEESSITCSKDIYMALHPYLMDLNHEEFWLICLNRRNKILKISQISKGGINSTLADPKVLFKIALDHKASSIIITHNHPSGGLKPSQADIQLTQKLKKGGELLEIPVLDHIIYTNNGYFSFADENML